MAAIIDQSTSELRVNLRGGARREWAQTAIGWRRRELDCGHVPQIERPEQTNAAISEFFSRVARPPEVVQPEGQAA